MAPKIRNLAKTTLPRLPAPRLILRVATWFSPRFGGIRDLPYTMESTLKIANAALASRCFDLRRWSFLVSSAKGVDTDVKKNARTLKFPRETPGSTARLYSRGSACRHISFAKALWRKPASL